MAEWQDGLMGIYNPAILPFCNPAILPRGSGGSFGGRDP
jgi:hypothetical protein